ncbi:LPS assembly protein LptD [Paucibacter sp. APW11]|uniref:LPS-assembly protein LptD n=1 Tax=Roseateles aquae TaxID=3077235 RepID=A0ABU3PA79_9BURK|nr:LPS assembly protein LptD [Paucibacter sp. APW11]MDT8999433.1 LPS assembly protein LptD [Paucibacter sp. APW11]
MAALLGAALGAEAQLGGPPTDSVAQKLRPTRQLSLTRRQGEQAAMIISAEHLSSRVDQETEASGQAELRMGDTLLRAERLRYVPARDLASAEGGVEISRNGNTVRGPSLQLFVERFEGELLQPNYFFAQTGGSGHATRLRFLGESRLLAEQATYSTCPVDEQETQPAWQLKASSLRMDFEANEGVAKDAVLQFYGVPILATSELSFPLGDARKSGLLPINIGTSSRSGLEIGMPYYWNIAPQRDATFMPFWMTGRGYGVDSEFRYLEPSHEGQFNLAWLAHDRVVGRSRWDLSVEHRGSLGERWHYEFQAERVSDDDYWKDLSNRVKSKTPRLLSSNLNLGREDSYSWGDAQWYARVQRWQALEGSVLEDQFISPYQRSPQLGLRLNSRADDLVLGGFRPWGRRTRLEGGMELEYNRFDLPGGMLTRQPTAAQSGAVDPTGQRLHLLAHLSLPMGSAAWWLIPRLSVNAASYRLDQPVFDGRYTAARSIPTFSLDHGWVFERTTSLFGQSMLQSLEPRALYVNTPYRAQNSFPMFDTAAKDFNFDSIYAENQFSGVDRVSDAHQLTLGATSRWLNANSGEELLRLGMVQRMLLRDQSITADGQPSTQRVSDLLLLGSAHLNSHWWTDAAIEYNPQSRRTVRSLLAARYSPGPFRTISVDYRLARGQSEQVGVAWQWPLFGAAARPDRRGSSSASCSGAWYTAGRLQYSLLDRRLADSVLGVEYDAGCWILRVGAERTSTGRFESNTRALLQIEFVGLAALGPNALRTLKDNIPGYRPLSSDRSASSNASYD